jgi:hypothetical protein
MTGTPGGHRIVTLGVNELESLPGLVAALQREVLQLICPDRHSPQSATGETRREAYPGLAGAAAFRSRR